MNMLFYFSHIDFSKHAAFVSRAEIYDIISAASLEAKRISRASENFRVFSGNGWGENERKRQKFIKINNPRSNRGAAFKPVNDLFLD